MTMKKIMVSSLVLMLIISSSHMETVESSSFDCYDACNTGCVGLSQRLYQRCDRKCSIKCNPGHFPTQLSALRPCLLLGFRVGIGIVKVIGPLNGCLVCF